MSQVDDSNRDTALVQFSDIESFKENIQPTRGGYSAQTLAKVALSNSTSIESKDIHASQRKHFEDQIIQSTELDDPIEPYLDYIKWINATYPQGHSSESGLVQLLEKCTSQFRDASFYKDDSRYLKVWMQYARYSDTPKEIFTYLARKEIGRHLALFYEEYASYLEATDRKNQADEVYQLGLAIGARPSERLKRRYHEFCERLAANPPSANESNSPILPVVRQALASKDGGSALAPAPTESFGESSSTGIGLDMPKVQVFNDPSGTQAGKAVNLGGWDSIGSLASRRKENVVHPQAWAGQTLSSNFDNSTKKTLTVFKDPVSK